MHTYNNVYTYKIIFMMRYEYCLNTHVYIYTIIYTIMYAYIR